MVSYEMFLDAGIDLAPLGIGAGERHSDYFCTPLGAEVIGWEGVDGIHCCFVEGFGEWVFAVNPMNGPGSCVQPVARSFEALLRLLLSCGHWAALEQAHGWNREQFEQFLRDNPSTPEQTALLDRIRETFALAPMEDPFSYIKELQSSFDCGALRFGEDYTPPAETRTPQPPWKVTFESNFWGHYGQGHAGKELPLDLEFPWGDRLWRIPAIYLCTAGIVVDLCAQIPPEPIRAFLDKWKSCEHGLTPEERERLEAENPTNLDVSVSASLNGRILRQKHGCGTVWVPPSCVPTGERVSSPEAERVLDHYGLDRSQGWVVCRAALPWATKRKPAHLRRLTLHLERRAQAVPGPRFTAAEAGQRVSFIHPVTGAEHVLTVLSYEREELDGARFHDETMDYPTHCAALTYAISPELSREAVQVQDCAPGDSPRSRSGAGGAFAVAVIGGAAGAAALSGGAARTACSSLYFERPETIQWRVVFYEKPEQDRDVELLREE